MPCGAGVGVEVTERVDGVGVGDAVDVVGDGRGLLLDGEGSGARFARPRSPGKSRGGTGVDALRCPE
jgi:hypothetical protein